MLICYEPIRNLNVEDAPHARLTSEGAVAMFDGRSLMLMEPCS